MVGGTVLVLPLLGLQTGYYIIPIVTFVLGVISLYTCYLIIVHAGQAQNIKDVILDHLNQNKKILFVYDLFIAISIGAFILNYFKLIVIQV